MDAIKILGSLLSSGAVSSGSGANILSSVLKMAAGGSSGGGGGGLGDLVGGLMGGGNSNQGSGGLGELIGGLMGGGKSNSGGGGGDLGDLMGSLLGGGQSSGGGGGIGGLLGAALGQYQQSQQKEAPATRADHCDYLPSGVSQSEANGQAEMMIRAMINAAKSDGRVDAEEQEKIVGRLGEIEPEELVWVKQELAAPLDVDSFARSVPRGMEQQIYAMSLMAIDLDTNTEAKYLHQLAQGTGISHEMSNQIHEQLGVAPLYS